MVTVAHLVEKIIEQRPFVQEALARGIINNAALAEQLIPELEKELKKKVKFSAVNMAIRRLSEKLEKTFIKRAKFDKDTDLTIKSDLVEITVFKSEDIQNKIKKLYDFINFKRGDFLTITQGLHEVTIFTNNKHSDKIKKLFTNKQIKIIIKNLSSITINIPEESVTTIGLFYIVTRALNWNNINIVDIVSTYTEMTFILNEDDVSNAFNTLKELIHKNS